MIEFQNSIRDWVSATGTKKCLKLCLTWNNIGEERKGEGQCRTQRRLLLPTTKCKDTLSNSCQDQQKIIHTTNLGLSKNGRSDATVLCQTEIIADELRNTKKSDQKQQCMRIRSDVEVDE